MLALLVASILFVLFALIESEDDFAQIRRKEDVEHTEQWLMRGTFAALYLVFCGELWWIVGLGGLFSAVFRLSLNTRRERHALYVAPWSNLYNRVAYAAVVSVEAGRPIWPDDRWINGAKKGYFNKFDWAVRDIHRTGKLLYIAEVTAFLGTIAIELFF